MNKKRLSLVAEYSIDNQPYTYIRARYVDENLLYVLPEVPPEIEEIISEVKDLAIDHDFKRISIERDGIKLKILEVVKWQDR